MDRTFAYIDSNIDRFVDELLQLCRQPSVSATGEGIQEMAVALQNLMAGMGAQVRLIPTPGAPIVYARFPGRGDKTLMFYNHYDVVAAGDRSAWKSEPFQPEIRDDTVYGRGVADNKGSFLSRLKAVEALLATEGSLPLNVVFVVEGEEEAGSPHLEQFAIEHADILRADGVVWEGGFKNYEDTPEISLGVKGWCGLEMRLKTADHELHSMLGTVAPNALWAMVRTLHTLQTADGTIQVPGFYDDVVSPTEDELSIIERIPYDWERFKEETGIEELAVQGSNAEIMVRHLLQPTCTLTGLSGGHTGVGKKNAIPNKAMAKVEFRLVPDQDPDDILIKVERHVRASAQGQWEVEFLGTTVPCRAPMDSDIARATITSCQDTYGLAPIVYPLSAGSSPLYKLAHRLGIPAVLAGCASANSNMHGPNENLRITKDLLPGTKHMAALIKRFADY